MDKGKTEPYRVIVKGGEGEITEKKSRFIAIVREVESEEEAESFLQEVRKKYWDARHHCSAFVIGRKAEITRCSDDGEPSGTAGRPMLEVLLGLNLRNTGVVVTRYFGGTLLGTGGLVRAYSLAVKEAVKNCETGVMRYGQRLRVGTDYNGIGKILYILGQMGIEQEESEYTDSVHLKILVPGELCESLSRELVEATGGKVRIDPLEETYFIDKEGTL